MRLKQELLDDGNMTVQELINKLEEVEDNTEPVSLEIKEKDGVSLFKVSIGPYYRKEYLIRLQETVNIIGITGTKIVLNKEILNSYV